MSNPTVPIRYLSVCSGMEAASVAWHPLGWTPVGFSEIEPFPCAILKHRFPNVPNYGSLTEYQSWPLEPGAIDLLVGGTPCQSFSVAGKRGGLNDPRGQLMFSFLGLAEKLGKPRWIVWENVPGCLSSGEPKGSDFGCLIQGLVELGYGFAYRVLDAQHFGVPQRRRRVFVVACLGDWRAAAEVLSLREGLRGYLETGKQKRKATAADAGASVEASGGCWWDGGQVSQTLDAVLAKGQTMPEKNRFPAVLTPYTASSFAQYSEGVGTVRASGGDLGGGSETLLTQPIPYRKSKRACSRTGNERVEGCNVPMVQPAMAVRRLTPTECLRLQGFPDGWSQIPWKGKPASECPDGPQYKAAGNSMAVPCMFWIGERIAAYELNNTSQNHETK